jgi:hypothetical protein
MYPEWSKLTRDLSLLHPLMFKQLRTVMCFIVIADGEEHVAIVVRVPSNEFIDNIASAPMRLDVALYRFEDTDLFPMWVVIEDAKSLWWAETRILPYETQEHSLNDPLSEEGLKRLRLLLGQEFSHCLIVDEYNKLRCTRKVWYTKNQRQRFATLAEKLGKYEGKRIGLSQAKNIKENYLARVSLQDLTQRFEALLREEQAPTIQRIYTDIDSFRHPDEIQEEFRCPGCGKLVSHTIPRNALCKHEECGTVIRIQDYKITRIDRSSE